MIAFIDDRREAHGVEPICKVLPIAPSTYHDHAARRRDPSRLSARAKRDEVLKVEVRRVFRGELPGLRRAQALAATIKYTERLAEAGVEPSVGSYFSNSP